MHEDWRQYLPKVKRFRLADSVVKLTITDQFHSGYYKVFESWSKRIPAKIISKAGKNG